MRYYTKYILFALGSLLIYVLSYGIISFPHYISWIPTAEFEYIPLWVWIASACIGRAADASSTVIGLSSTRVVEGAPELGHNPSAKTLFNLSIYQSVLIVLLATLISKLIPDIVYAICYSIAATSLMAVISNVLLRSISGSIPGRTPDEIKKGKRSERRLKAMITSQRFPFHEYEEPTYDVSIDWSDMISIRRFSFYSNLVELLVIPISIFASLLIISYSVHNVPVFHAVSVMTVFMFILSYRVLQVMKPLRDGNRFWYTVSPSSYKQIRKRQIINARGKRGRTKNKRRVKR